MAGNPFYKDHWINIDRDRLDRYERMFLWSPASAALYEPADIRPGHIVADFGSGPGHTAIEIAKWVGRNGHVHALDINAEFVAQARKNANAASIGDRVTAHQCDGSILPLPDLSLDRLTTRTTSSMWMIPNARFASSTASFELVGKCMPSKVIGQ